MSGRCRVRKSPGRAILHELCWDFPRSEAGLGEQEGRGAKGRRSEPRRAGGGWWEGSAALSPPALSLLLQGSPPCDPLLTLPTSQPCPGPLPRSRYPRQALFVRGRLRALWGGCPALALRAGWSCGSLPGARRAGRAAIVRSGASGLPLAGEKAQSIHSNTFRAPRLPSPVPLLELSRRCQYKG